MTRAGSTVGACLFALGLSGCATELPPTPAADPALAIEHVTVIPMTCDEVLSDRTVVIRDGRIETVAEADTIDLPPGTEIVDGRGRFLLPSFVDTHVHLDDVGDLSVLLAHGIGAVRNMDGVPYHLFIGDLVDSDALTGPYFTTCGPYTNAPRIATPEDAATAVREQHAQGYDCVKIHGELSLESLQALGRAAVELNIPVVGHAPRNLDLADVLATGVMTEISHAEEYLYTWYAHRSEDGWTQAAAEATHAARVAVAPTLVMYRSILRQVRDLDAELDRIPLELAGPFARRSFRPSSNRYRKKFTLEDAEWLGAYLDEQKTLVAALHDAGVVLLTGTDANAPSSVPGFSLHEELELLVEVGLSPLAALQAGTRNGWDTVAGAGLAGRVAEGLQAELVLLEADPLDDIRNSSSVAGIVRRGEWIEGAKLRAAMTEQTQRYAADQPFVDRLWDNDIGDAMIWYAARKTEVPDFVVSSETLVCQAMRAFRDGAPETALQTLDVLLRDYPDDALAARLQGQVRAALAQSTGFPVRLPR